VTQSGLRLKAGMEFDSWLATGRRLAEFCSGASWWLGDWLVYGEETYGRRYEAAMRATPLDYQTLRNYAWVARRVPMSRRRDTLSFQHHAEVAALPDAEQDLWLQRAERMKWSRNELRRRLAANRRGEAEVLHPRPVVVHIAVTPDRERRWRSAAAEADQPLSVWMSSTVDAAADAMLARRRRRITAQ